MRYERKWSNSLWHTDWKVLPCGRQFLCYEDDISRFVTGYGVFEGTTAENALLILEEAVRNHGMPAVIMTDHGSQFYPNESSARMRGKGAYERELARLGMGRVLSGIRHPRTNGKAERLFGEIKRKSRMFACPVSGDGIARLIRIYDDRPRVPLDDDMSHKQAFGPKKAEIQPKTGEQA